VPLALGFWEVASGVKTYSVQFRRLLDSFALGDAVMVTQLDRLARSTRDLVNTPGQLPRKRSRF
jgi:DNA invertase Pin-like site-specific DNA recombinase